MGVIMVGNIWERNVKWECEHREKYAKGETNRMLFSRFILWNFSPIFIYEWLVSPTFALWYTVFDFIRQPNQIQTNQSHLKYAHNSEFMWENTRKNCCTQYALPAHRTVHYFPTIEILSVHAVYYAGFRRESVEQKSSPKDRSRIQSTVW